MSEYQEQEIEISRARLTSGHRRGWKEQEPTRSQATLASSPLDDLDESMNKGEANTKTRVVNAERQRASNIPWLLFTY